MTSRAAVPAAAATLVTLVGLLVLAGCGNGVVPAGPASVTPSPAAGSSATAGRSPSTSSSTGRPSRSFDRSASPVATAAPSDPAPSATASASPTGSAGDPSASPSESASASASASASPSDTPESTASTPDGQQTEGGRLRRTCRLDDLDVGVVPAEGGGAAGSSYVLLTFANRSADTCWMYGYPGVAFVGGGNGTQLGAEATRTDPADVRMVRVGAGRRTTAVLQIADAHDYDETTCVPTEADGFRVYPPASLTAAYVKFPALACAGRKAKQLTVSPVGTSG